MVRRHVRRYLLCAAVVAAAALAALGGAGHRPAAPHPAAESAAFGSWFSSGAPATTWGTFEEPDSSSWQ